MSSYYGSVDCPQCQSEAEYLYYCSTGDEWVQCSVCGYNYERQALMDRKRQANDPENREFYKLTNDGHLIHREYVNRGYGAYVITPNKGSITFGGFHKPLTQKVIDKFEKVIAQADVVADRCHLTRWDEETNQVEIIFGSIVNPLVSSEEDMT